MQLQFLVLSLALAPSLVSAAIFPPNTLVKMIDGKGFKKVMKQNETSIVAFVAPWCGYCQRMAPEYSKAATALDPLIPLYAVDCDAEKNKPLCSQQGVKGFPTVKLFPRGNQLAPVDFESGERTANAFFYWASRKVPHTTKKITQVEDIEVWAKKNVKQPRAILLNKDKKLPLLWQVLSNRYQDEIPFASHMDKKGKSASTLGFKAEAGKSKVLVYPAGSTKPVLYAGVMKKDALVKFFNSILDGTADLPVSDDSTAAAEASAPVDESHVPGEPEVDAPDAKSPQPDDREVLPDSGQADVEEKNSAETLAEAAEEAKGKASEQKTEEGGHIKDEL